MKMAKLHRAGKLVTIGGKICGGVTRAVPIIEL